MLDLITAIVTFVAAYAAAKLLLSSLNRMAEKSQSTVNDRILNLIKKPLYTLIVLFGLYAALMQIQYLANMREGLTNGFRVIFIVVSTYTIIRLLKIIEEWYLIRIIDPRFLPTIGKAISIFVYVIAFIIILDQLGIEVTPLIASLGVATLAVGLALQDTISNFFAGLYIFTDKPLRIGDFIELDTGDNGYVDEIGWRSTRIKTLANNTVIIPNSKIVQSKITNYYLPQEEMSVMLQCGVSYDSDLDKVEKVTIEVAREVQKKVTGGVKSFEPFIRYHTFGESNINFSIILRVEKFVDQYLLVHEFIKKLMKRYRKEGIEISFPVRISYSRKEK